MKELFLENLERFYVKIKYIFSNLLKLKNDHKEAFMACSIVCISILISTLIFFWGDMLAMGIPVEIIKKNTDIISEQDLENYYKPQFQREKELVEEEIRIRKITHSPSFRELTGNFSRDKNNIYYKYEKIVKADADTFVLMGSNNQVYELQVDTVTEVGSGYTSSGEFIEKDISAFSYVNYSYAKDKENVYFEDLYGLKTLELSSFVYTKKIIKDSNNIYLYNFYADNNSLGGYSSFQYGDLESFRYIGPCYGQKFISGYSIDKDFVYKDTDRLEDVDVSTFKYLGIYTTESLKIYNTLLDVPYTGSYAKDQFSVYTGCGNVLTEADSLTFKYLTGGYGQDKKSIWFSDSKLDDEVDYETFQVIQNGYAKDKNRVYFQSLAIDGLSPFAFEVVQDVKYPYYVYLKNSETVYHGGQSVKGVSPLNCTESTIKKCSESLDVRN